jgi:DNA-binding winged helix-turn-helix (wHTH) protein
MSYQPVNSIFEVDFEQRELVNRKNGTRTALEPRLAKVLRLLMGKPGCIINRREIIDQIWGNYESGDELLTHSISMLRKCLNDTSIIKTIPKQGYIFTGQVPPPVEQKKWSYQSINKYHVWSLFIFFLILVMIKGIFWPHHH